MDEWLRHGTVCAVAKYLLSWFGESDLVRNWKEIAPVRDLMYCITSLAEFFVNGASSLIR